LLPIAKAAVSNDHVQRRTFEIREVSAKEGVRAAKRGARPSRGVGASRRPGAQFEPNTEFVSQNQNSNLVLMRRCVMLDNAEFSFHLHKLLANARRPASFTIAMWEGTVLHDICHAQPLDDALAAFSKILEGMGKGGREEVCRLFESFGNEVTAQ
jgi:hypothetical protein